MGAAQEAAWHVLLDLDELHDEPWVLIGGQMTMIHCLEHGIDGYRTTDDGDVVLGVWARRDALSTTSRYLQERGFHEVQTHDRFGYRYVRGDTMIDLLLPEGLERQRKQPITATGRPGLAIEGGNQALLRAQRVPVRIGTQVGYVRRPRLTV